MVKIIIIILLFNNDNNNDNNNDDNNNLNRKNNIQLKILIMKLITQKILIIINMTIASILFKT